MGKIGLLHKNDVYRTVDEAFEYLRSQQNIKKDKGGWHQFLESGKIGNVATAQVLIIYKQYNRQIPNLNSCIKFLLSNIKEMVWENKKVYGWSYVSSGPSVPCAEPTCWVYLAFQILDLPGRQKIESIVYNFLKKSKIESQEGTSWGFTPWSESRISTTSLALRALCRIGDAELIKDTIRWLLAARNSDNVWGQLPKSASTITHTALATLALKEAGYSSSNLVIQSAFDFLVEKVGLCLKNKDLFILNSNQFTGINEIVDIAPQPDLSLHPSRIQYHYNPILLASHVLETEIEDYLPYIEALSIFSIKDWAKHRWKHPWLKEHQHVTSWSFYDHLLSIVPLFNRWANEKDSSILYIISTDGNISIKASWLSKLIHKIKKRSTAFLIRCLLLTIGLVAFVIIILDIMDLKTIFATIILGVISNIIYTYYKN